MKSGVQKPVYSYQGLAQMSDVHPASIGVQTFVPDKQFMGHFKIVHSDVPLLASVSRLASSPSAASWRMT